MAYHTPLHVTGTSKTVLTDSKLCLAANHPLTPILIRHSDMTWKMRKGCSAPQPFPTRTERNKGLPSGMPETLQSAFTLPNLPLTIYIWSIKTTNHSAFPRHATAPQWENFTSTNSSCQRMKHLISASCSLGFLPPQLLKRDISWCSSKATDPISLTYLHQDRIHHKLEKSIVLYWLNAKPRWLPYASCLLGVFLNR